MKSCSAILDVITRRKSLDIRRSPEMELHRNLNVLDLIGIGIGSCAGLGIFVTSAHVARHEAGPGVILSVLVASVAAVLSGLSHVELATRMPRPGSSYYFCYVTLGELLAFTLGWNIIVDNVIRGAAATKAACRYLEYMRNSSPESNLTYTEGTEGQVIQARPDIYACCCNIALTLLALTSVKTSSIATYATMTASGVIVLALICVGFFHVAPENWNSQPGFFAEGFQGIMSGAAVLLSTFAGIDSFTSCAGESQTPCKSLPTAFKFVVIIVSTSTFLVVLAVTLAIPWSQLSDNAALARAFDAHGIFAAKYVIGCGAVFGLLPVAIASFRQPVALMSAMAKDRLLPKLFSKTAFSGVVIYSHIFTGTVIALCSLVVNLPTLVELSALATSLQFIVSPFILLCIRYHPNGFFISHEYSKIDFGISSKQKNMYNDLHEEKESYSKAILLPNEDPQQLKNENYYKIQNDVLPGLPRSSLLTLKVNTTSKRPSCIYMNAHNISSNPPLTRFENLLSRSTMEVDHLQRDVLSHGFMANELDHFSMTERKQRENRSLRTNETLSTPPEDTILENPSFTHTKQNTNSILSCPRHQAHSDERTWKRTGYCLVIYFLSSVCLSATSHQWYHYTTVSWWILTLAGVSVVVMFLSGAVIARQPQNCVQVCYTAPYVPLGPLISITVNMLLLAALPVICWVRLALLLVPSLLLYTFFKCRDGSQPQPDDHELMLSDVSHRSSR